MYIRILSNFDVYMHNLSLNDHLYIKLSDFYAKLTIVCILIKVLASYSISLYIQKWRH